MKTRNSTIHLTSFTLILLFALVFSANLSCGVNPAEQKGIGKETSVQEPCVSGYFYPANAEKLAAMVDGFITNAKLANIEGRVIGVLAPHAGYPYSGGTAGYSYKLVKNLKPKRVLVIGFRHDPRTFSQSRFVTTLKKYYRTPLGDVGIDIDAVKKLMAAESGIENRPDAFASEHSLEVQLPFLQRALPQFTLIPILMIRQSPDTAKALADAIHKAFPQGDAVFVIASSDMCHYMPADTVKTMDEDAFKWMKTLDTEGLYKDLMAEKTQLCGFGPVMTLMELTRLSGGGPGIVLNHSDSGDATGDKSSVVGYGSVAFAAAPGKGVGSKTMNNSTKPPKASTEQGALEGPMKLTKEQKKALLDLARRTVDAVVKEKKDASDVPLDSIKDEALKKQGAAFVTIKKKGELRGCIGQIMARGALDACVRDMAAAAAVQDPRFAPVSTAELKDLEFEISVLTPMEKVTDISTIEVGTDGLYIKKGWYSGLLLPQVATEYGWTREEFLAHTCRKAGLPPDEWKKNVDLFKFSATVFSEKELE
jgi:hypothetical protein